MKTKTDESFVDAIATDLLVSYARDGFSPIELKAVYPDFLMDPEEEYLGDDRLKAIVQRAADKSGYLLRLDPHEEGDRFADYAVLVNPCEDNIIIHLEPGQNPRDCYCMA